MEWWTIARSQFTACPWRIGELVRFSAMSHCYTEAKQQFANHTREDNPSNGRDALRQDREVRTILG